MSVGLHLLESRRDFVESGGAQVAQGFADVLVAFVGCSSVFALAAGPGRRIAGRGGGLLRVEGKRSEEGGEQREEGSCFHGWLEPRAGALVAMKMGLCGPRICV